MSVRRDKGRGQFIVEFQYAGRRIYRRLPSCATEDDAKQIEEKLRRQLFEDSTLNGKPTPGQRAAMHQLDPTEWTKLAGMLLSCGPVRPRSGIYFLCRRGRLIYIGKSRNVATRLGGHFNKNYDHICMIEIAPSRLAEIEEYLIRMLRPRLNSNLNGGEKGRGRGWDMDGRSCTPPA